MSAAPGVPAMRLEGDAGQAIRDEADVYGSLLPLCGARIIELGCGAAQNTRAIARDYAVGEIVAFEVDRVQHEKNIAAPPLSNVTFRYGGAEAIDESAAAFDLSLMFKSLHHVPVPNMDQALNEIHRILKPGGLAYFSEPVFAGPFNDILRLFHDEQAVRAAAFAALERAVARGLFVLETEIFFLARVHFEDFADFERKIIAATHSRHSLSAETHAEVAARMQAHHGPSGIRFEAPMRVDVLRKTAV